MSQTILRVFRGKTVGEAVFSEYAVDGSRFRTVLDALEWIRGGVEPDLRYRHSCHHGSCGTCGALIDGVERLMCLSVLAELGPGPVTVEPLRKMDELGDIAVDPQPLFREIPDSFGYVRESELPHELPREDGRPYARMENCIECGLCVSACPVREDFAGPAALAAADREREERPQNRDAALAFAARPEGVAACRRHFACSRVCPLGVYPGRRIENLRKSLADAR
ncbi:MAG TPA: 2Fe-2S iron-sulfur cluster-binding protein [Rectinemataceae bacterium]|nr:2Fe-2S iron-sulfur cluster-binding protein [Rectinemataceae bacterium]